VCKDVNGKTGENAHRAAIGALRSGMEKAPLYGLPDGWYTFLSKQNLRREQP